jgi:hypothetical protein
VTRFLTRAWTLVSACLLGTFLVVSVVGLAGTPEAGAAGIASTAGGNVVGHGTASAGIWVVADCGCLYAYNVPNVPNVGDAGELSLSKPIVGISSTEDGQGYWMAASDGGVFNYGDAGFYGSLGSVRLNQPIVGIAGNNASIGRGYWMVASDGGVFTFGDAVFHGSHGGSHLNQPVVGMVATPDGGGYWLVASDGNYFPYGDAPSFGAYKVPVHPVVGITAAP